MQNTAEKSIKDQIDSASQAFTRQAPVYDDYEVDNENLKRVRNEIYKHVLRFIRPTDKILEINAGTGTDAVFFAQNGYRIHATDVAAGMVEVIKEKAKAKGLEEKLTTQQLSFTELSPAVEKPYAYCFSNIGGLNCIPDLTQFTEQLPLALPPGGVVTIVIMPRLCPWEWLELFRGRAKVAFRRLQKGGAVVSPKGIPYHIYYFSPSNVIKAFAPKFRLLKLQSLSLFAPPMDRKQFPKRHPQLYKFFVALDNLFTHRFPFNRLGDFLIFSFRYEP